MKKILIITYYWPPSGGPGVQRWLKFVKYLPAFNIEPIVITVNPQKAAYPIIDESLKYDISPDVEVHYTNTLEPFGILKKIFGIQKIPYGGNELEYNIKFVKKILHFIRGNFFIPDSRRGWNLFAYRKARDIIAKYNIDTVITTSPPHSTQLIGLKLKRKIRVKWIADLRDPWTDIIYYNIFYHTFIASAIDKSYELKVLKHADKLHVIGKSTQNILLGKVNADIKGKFEILPNGYDEDDFKSLIREIPKNEIIIIHTGTITNIYNIDGLIAALKSILLKGIKVKVKLIGNLNKSIKEKIYESGIDKIVEYSGYVNHTKAIEYLCRSTLLLLLIPQIENNKWILPGKLFEYLGVKKPILCLGPVDCDAAEIINNCDAGKTFDYGNVIGISDFISQFTDSSIHNTYYKNNFRSNYSRYNLTKQLASSFYEV
jgi:glycosyltransferase involved in cell wall biosynthesis